MRRPVPGSLALLALLGAGLACGETRSDAEPRAAAPLAIHADTRETGYIVKHTYTQFL